MPEFKNGEINLTDAEVERVKQVIEQAKASLKMVGSMVNIPESLLDSEGRKQLTNERILSGLKSVGLASTAELEALADRVARLESTVSRMEKEITDLKSAPKPEASPKID